MGMFLLETLGKAILVALHHPNMLFDKRRVLLVLMQTNESFETQ
ncbi:MAG: hypothetical protein KatS3mg025_1410 [Bacteroidia bacterium]|jgi:hypothetical protein|nr:MAG: hypothetical protein KatS3mg025_1410 [Bacteroidia bacterium]